MWGKNNKGYTGNLPTQQQICDGRTFRNGNESCYGQDKENLRGVFISVRIGVQQHAVILKRGSSMVPWSVWGEATPKKSLFDSDFRTCRKIHSLFVVLPLVPVGAGDHVGHVIHLSVPHLALRQLGWGLWAWLLSGGCIWGWRSLWVMGCGWGHHSLLLLRETGSLMALASTHAERCGAS